MNILPEVSNLKIGLLEGLDLEEGWVKQVSKDSDGVTTVTLLFIPPERIPAFLRESQVVWNKQHNVTEPKWNPGYEEVTE